MKRSLTRSVFRAIIAEEPYCVSESSRSNLRGRYGLLRQRPAPSLQKRYLFKSAACFNAKTFLSRLEREVQDGDLEMAKTTYHALSSEDPITDDSDLPALNRFLTALCWSQDADPDLIMRILEPILERERSLDVETMRGLCRVFLVQDNLEAAIELLQSRVESYSFPDRYLISQAFKDFILDKSIEAQRAFNAYELLRSAFPETSVQERLLLMHSFFDRTRPDLACLVFGHMRQHEDPATRPTAGAYGQCFQGIGRCQDIDGLQMVYNMLKLDLHVEPTTRVRNGLMAAYIGCGQPFTAIIDHFWKILDSWEGPTMRSFALALRACETWIPQGAMEARKIIALMQSWQLDISKEIYDCYVGAIAGQCEFENTIELIDDMEAAIGVAPDAFTIGSFYNAIPWQYRKDEVEAWAQQTHPDLWRQLLSYGEQIDEDWEIRYFDIDRGIDISGDRDPLIYHRDEHTGGDGEPSPRLSTGRGEMEKSSTVATTNNTTTTTSAGLLEY